MFAAMLAEDADKPLEHYVKNDQWWGFQKYDGRRLMVANLDGRILAMNRKGEPFKFPITEFETEIRDHFQGWWLDGEWLDGKYVVFDALYAVGIDFTSHPFGSRYASLANQFEQIPYSASLRLSPAHVSVAQKINLHVMAQEENLEGIIFRTMGGTYQFGLRSKAITKVKFWKTADCIVYNVGREGKNSVSVAVFKDSEPVGIGAVTMTTARMKTIKVGDIIEVKYLYATDDDRLYQPAFLRVRDDKNAFDCTIDQLEHTNKSTILGKV